MLKDITLGQFFPGDSIVHRLDARFKLVTVFLFMVTLFSMKGPFSISIMAAFVLLAVILSKISPKMIARSLRPLVMLILFTVLLNMLFTPGTPIWEFGILKITREGIDFSIMMAVRIILLITGTALLTYTTSPIMLTDAIESLFSPLKKLKVPVGEFAMMMSIALRFIPDLLDETSRIMASQKARGADFESGNILRRIKAFVPVLVPVFVGAFKRADELAVAMESRCYRDGDGRTRLKVLKSSRGDWLTLLFCIAVFGVAMTLGLKGM